MLMLKVSSFLLLAIVVVAEKKIELQDIEDDNLKSEKEIDKSNAHSKSSGTPQGLQPLDFLKSGLLRYFQRPVQPPQQSRYVHQYAVSEAPERAPVDEQYAPPTAQQAMVGYLSNVPMQVYLVPQSYNEHPEQAVNPQSRLQYASPTGVPRVSNYPTAPELVQPQSNYVEVPAYVTPTGKTYIQPVAYVSYAMQPTIVPAQTTVAPVVTYQTPVVQYQTSIAAPPVVPKGYYHNTHYTGASNTVEVQDEEIESHTEVPYTKQSSQEYPRYYNSRAPIREEHRYKSLSQLPAPNPLLLKGAPSHLAHIPKALPMYRPYTRPVYAASGSLISNGYTPRPSDAYGVPYKRRPTSLLDSYIPSSIQLEYLKRGYAKDPLSVYEALSSGRHFPPSGVVPRYYERGFLPNQMYHTAAGGVTYGHYKRTPKLEKVSQ